MDTVSSSTRDIVLYAVPLIALLLVSMFRLDEFFGSRRGAATGGQKQHRRTSMRSSMMSDPDGRPWTT